MPSSLPTRSSLTSKPVSASVWTQTRTLSTKSLDDTRIGAPSPAKGTPAGAVPSPVNGAESGFDLELFRKEDWDRITRVTDFKDIFEFHEKIGQGISGKVFRVDRKTTDGSPSPSQSKSLALKIFRPMKGASESFLNELDFLSRVSVLPGVIGFEGAYTDGKKLCIAMEYARLDLYTRIKKNGRLTERKCKLIIRNLLDTVAVLHSYQIVHRDIKPQNIVFTTDAPLMPKLIDWTDATALVHDLAVYTDLRGTSVYLAPERWRPRNGWEIKASEVWAIGVTLFEMLTGKRVFFGDTQDQIRDKIVHNLWRFPRGIQLSHGCVDFIDRCLTYESGQRMNCRYLMGHEWLLPVEENPHGRFLSGHRHAHAHVHGHAHPYPRVSGRHSHLTEKTWGMTETETETTSTDTRSDQQKKRIPRYLQMP